MIRDVASVSVPGNRDDVLKVLQKKRVSGVPVVKNDKVVGMITRTDLLKNREEDQVALLMSRSPVTISPNDTLVEAARLLVKHRIRRLPVVEDGALAGIISIADIVKVGADLAIDIPIERYIEKEIVVLWSEMPLPVAGAIMEYAAAEACPVIDTNLTLVGIISDRDLIKASIIEDSVTKTDMSVDAGEDAWMWDRIMQTTNKYYEISRIRLRNIKVGEAMVPPITATKGSEVSKCAAAMSKGRIDQMPVVSSSQKLMGMLVDRDIINAFIEHCESNKC
jgi:CBS domain-containing protein